VVRHCRDSRPTEGYVNSRRHPLDIDAPISFSACRMETCRRAGALAGIDVIMPRHNFGRFLHQGVDSVFGKTGAICAYWVRD
jgi:hypothetical protein